MTETATSMARDSAAVLPFFSTCVSESTYEIDPLSDPRWKTLVDGHSQSSVFHSPQWLSALRTAYGYKPVVVTTCSPEKPLTNGLVFCEVTSWLTGKRLVSLPFSDHCAPLIESQSELDALLAHMKQRLGREKWEYIEIRPISHQPGAHTELHPLVSYHLHTLNLAPEQKQLFRNLHKDCIQRKTRRAEREKLRYEEGASEDLLQKFYRLLVMTRRRQCLPSQPLAWFRGLIAAFGKDLKIRVASKNGVPVASILTLSHKKSVVYKYGCSNAAFNQLGGTALLLWRTIQEAKDRGFEELELGRSDVDNAGLIAFKDRWGATRRSITYWSYPRRTSSRSSVWSRKVSRRVVPMIPDSALEAVGRLLYKHIG
jgi:CelD/BcsL family acetyltransferase involved in cellulose biosynthesis